jgi:hypothetical protein
MPGAAPAQRVHPAHSVPVPDRQEQEVAVRSVRSPNLSPIGPSTATITTGAQPYSDCTLQGQGACLSLPRYDS